MHLAINLGFTQEYTNPIQEEGGIEPHSPLQNREGDEESGSAHIEPYILMLKERIGNPTLFFCLDSGTLDYERFWITNSLRGFVMGRLRVNVLT